MTGVTENPRSLEPMPTAYHAVRAEELLLQADELLNEDNDMRRATVYLAAAQVHATLATVQGLVSVEDVRGVVAKAVQTATARRPISLADGDRPVNS